MNIRTDTEISSLTVERVAVIIKRFTKASGNLLGCVIIRESDIRIMDLGLGESSLFTLVAVTSLTAEFARFVDADTDRRNTHLSTVRTSKLLIAVWEFVLERGRVQIGVAIGYEKQRRSLFRLGKPQPSDIENLLRKASSEIQQILESD